MRSPGVTSFTIRYNHDLSPDGRFIAYESNESGRSEIYLQSFPEPGIKWAVSKEGGRQPVWSDGGSQIFFLNGSQMLAVDVDARGELRPGEPKILFDQAFRLNGLGGHNYDAAPDGARFAMIEGPEQTDDFELHVVLNWADELETRIASR